MAKVTITLEDQEDGSTKIEMNCVPQIEEGAVTPAQTLGWYTAKFIQRTTGQIAAE